MGVHPNFADKQVMHTWASLILRAILFKEPSINNPAKKCHYPMQRRPRGPEEMSKCREAKVAARHLLPLECRTIALTAGVILNDEN